LPPRIVLFGATGYTGRLVARELAAAGTRAVLAGRDRRRLDALAGELKQSTHHRDVRPDRLQGSRGLGDARTPLGGFEVAVADSARPDTVRALVGEGDVLVTTVGPFLVHGQAAVGAAVEAGAHYLDATGEPPFVRRVFEELGPLAEGRCGLVPAFGYDFVPGNLAGALALREAGEEATAVAVGYFVSGAGGFSTGTLASGAGMLLESSFAWRGGRLVRDRVASRVRAFPVRGRAWLGVSYGGSEHYALPGSRPACATWTSTSAGSAAAPGRCRPPRPWGRRWPACRGPGRSAGRRPRHWPGGPVAGRRSRPGRPAAPT
jgi:short subunit dehydrogenase-like uncharacterized protein